MFITGILLSFTACNHKSNTASDSSFSKLEAEFINRPDEARPLVMWRWIDCNASKEGINLDFKEMKEKEIGGAAVFDSGDGDPDDVKCGHADVALITTNA